MNSNHKDTFLSILKTIERSGRDSLIDFLEKSSFFSDPASCSEHNSYEGGLVEHSLNVYNILERNCSLVPEMENFKESIKIVGLLQDVCNIGTFQKVFKNTPVKSKDGKNKLKEDGRLIFTEKESYEPLFETHLPYPQGSLSTMIIRQHLKLNKLEDLAIQWHTGVYDQPQHLWHILKRAQKTHRLVFMLFAAKREAILYYGEASAGLKIQ